VSNPYGEGPDEPRRVRGWAVAVGIIVGLVGSVVWMTVVFVVAYSLSSEQSRSGPGVDWLVFVVFILPLPVSILLLCFRRTRQAAAGLVMGVAIGVLVLAGVCGSFLVPGLVA
jgi:drug/metabolite transporter (DMT)-like permease